MAMCNRCIHINVCEKCRKLDELKRTNVNCDDYIYVEDKWEFNDHEFNTKVRNLNKQCEYGVNHWCDGKVNKSELPEGEDKPKCPKYDECELRKNKLKEVTIRSKDDAEIY